MTDGVPSGRRTDGERDDADYPRPALGRRPWFAFLRRARILRRFALAMGEERTRPSGVRAVVLSADDWSSGPLLVATGGRLRRRGLKPVCGPFGLLVSGRSLLRAGLHGEVTWIGITAAGEVANTGSLGWMATCRRATVMVEIPATLGAPPVGTVVTVRPILAVWPAP